MTHRRTVYELPDHPGVILQDMDVMVETFRCLGELAVREGIPSPRPPKLEFQRLRSRTADRAPILCVVVRYRLPLGVIQITGASRSSMHLTYTPDDLLSLTLHLRDWQEKNWIISDFQDGVQSACKAAFSAFYLGLDGRWRQPTEADLPWLTEEAA